MNISIVVLNWRNFELTCKCVLSIFSLPELSDPDLRVNIVVCDNNSADGSVLKLIKFIEERALDRIEVIQTPINGGFSFGHNFALRYILETQSPDFFWLLNNDTKVEAGAIYALLESARVEPSVSFWGSNINSGAQGESFVSCYAFNLLIGRVTGVSIDEFQRLKLNSPWYKEYYVSGAALFIRKDVFETGHFLDESYFLYHEELDLMNRLGGPKVVSICINSHVEHLQGQSGLNASESKSNITEYYENLSLLTYVGKHRLYWLPFLLMLKLIVKPLTLVAKKNYSLILPFYKAVIDYTCGTTKRPEEL